MNNNKTEHELNGSETVICSVEKCKAKATCELAVNGNWFAVCKKHSKNIMLPRRKLNSSATKP